VTELQRLHAGTTVRQLCERAPSRYDLHTIRAAASLENAGSRAVLTKSGFRPIGAADPADLGGKPGTWFERTLGAEAR
jgi:ribosomal-protein-alanine N-acetyltransferase